MKPHGGGGRRRKAPPRRKKAAPPRRAAAKKGAAVSARPGRPGYGRTGKPAPVEGEGFSMMTVFLLIVAIALSVVIVMVMLPKNLSFIKGYPAGGIGNEKPRNLLFEVQEILGPRDRAITFSEEEVNAYVNDRIKGKQSGALSFMVNFKGAYVDFEEDTAEFFIERTVIGIPFTMSLRLERNRRGTEYRAGGGSIGRFSMSSRQFKPILDTFKRLSIAMGEETDALEKIEASGQVRFEDDKIVLDPTQP